MRTTDVHVSGERAEQRSKYKRKTENVFYWLWASVYCVVDIVVVVVAVAIVVYAVYSRLTSPESH